MVTQIWKSPPLPVIPYAEKTFICRGPQPIVKLKTMEIMVVTRERERERERLSWNMNL
jgi:hypothetical protein